MAETVLSMARSLLASAVSKAAAVAADEISLMLGVRKEIWFIKDELKTIQAFLMAAEMMEKKDLLLKVWVEQVSDLSYDIEDCLDEFMVHVGSQSLLQRLMKLKDRHRIADQIRSLKSRVEEVSNRNTRYSLIKEDLPSTSYDRDSSVEDIRNLSGSNIDEAELVGFTIPKQKLLQLIDAHANHGPPRVIWVVGMGGLGKTTLVRKVYEDNEVIAKDFPYHGWITVSQSFNKIELLKKMISDLLGYDSLRRLEEVKGKALDVVYLANYLRGELKEKRYFIVLDDLWTINAWNWIHDMAFPSDNNKGSRIIVTTRDVGLAKECPSYSVIYRLETLQIDDAIKLLLRKTNIRHEDIENDKNLQNTVKRLVEKCGRLPLAILTIGGILASKRIEDWGNFYKELPLELESNPSLEALRRMVTLSYNYLPSHLKPCFLYLSIFPEDFEIQRRRLVDRWIAEGFVRSRVGKTIEDVGESYFNELMNRSMILPSSKVNIEGKVKSCRVHDVIRDIMVSFSREEKFVYLIQGSGTNVAEENFRHVANHGREWPKSGMDWTHVRSLTFFVEPSMDCTPLVCLSKLRMLRVLDLDLMGTPFRITQNDMNNIVLLCHLKYLNVRSDGSLIYSLPRSIGNIQGLQVLDMGASYITTLPKEITKLRSLRSIRCIEWEGSGLLVPRCVVTLCLPLSALLILTGSEDSAVATARLHVGCSTCWFDTRGVRVPRGISSLIELQILEVVDLSRTSSKAIQELGELSQLRKLVVETEYATKKKCEKFRASIEKLSSLRSLSVSADSDQDRGLGWFVSSSSPPPHLRSLRLDGYLGEMSGWFRNLTQLVKIYLCMSQLKEDKTMEILGELPKLMLLRMGYCSYLGEKLVLGTGAFLNLRKLKICVQIKDLIHMRFEEGASPQMEIVKLEGCILKSGIIGIKHLPRLKEISLSYGTTVARLGTLEEEVNAHPNRPVLRLAGDRSHHDLVDVECGERSRRIRC